MTKILVTATPPTTNGDLHLGHLSGPYLAADVFARAQRMLGHEVLYISSTDDNQSYLLTKSLQENRTPMAVVEDYSMKIKRSLAQAQIEMDAFTSPLNEAHTDRVQQFLLKLYAEGKLEERTTQTCYCEQCERFLYEAYVKGGCPRCGKSSGGQFCEECGHPNDPLRLQDAKCSLCSGNPASRELKGLWFPIEPYRAQLEQYFHDNSHQWRPHLVRFFREILDYEELPALLISNPSDWGIPVPIAGFENQVINVWFEMLPGHIQTTAAATEHDEEQVNTWWRTGEESRLVQFFGFDNSIYYAIYHTAMSIAHGEYRLADNFLTNEFYLLEQKKFSTSRKHAIWGSEFFNASNSDWLRYHLCLTGPELAQTNFTMEQFERTLTGDTLRDLHQLCDRMVGLMEQGGAVQGQLHPQVRDRLDTYHSAFLDYYGAIHFSLRQAAAALSMFVKEGLEWSGEALTPVDAHAILRGLCLFTLPLTPSFGNALHALLYGADEAKRWELYPASLPVPDWTCKTALFACVPEPLLEAMSEGGL